MRFPDKPVSEKPGVTVWSDLTYPHTSEIVNIVRELDKCRSSSIACSRIITDLFYGRRNWTSEVWICQISLYYM